MATTSLYLIPRPDASNGNSVGTRTTQPPPEGTIVFGRSYGDTNDLDTVIELLRGMRTELLAMTGQPVAIRLDLMTLGQ